MPITRASSLNASSGAPAGHSQARRRRSPRESSFLGRVTGTEPTQSPSRDDANFPDRYPQRATRHRGVQEFRTRIDPPRLVLKTHEHAAVADNQFVDMSVDGPTSVWRWVGLIEDGLKDGAIGGSLCVRICNEVARDPDLGSAGAYQMRNERRSIREPKARNSAKPSSRNFEGTHDFFARRSKPFAVQQNPRVIRLRLRSEILTSE